MYYFCTVGLVFDNAFVWYYLLVMKIISEELMSRVRVALENCMGQTSLLFEEAGVIFKVKLLHYCAV